MVSAINVPFSQRLGLLIVRMYKQNVVNSVWWQCSASFRHGASGGAERSLTRSAGGRYGKHLTGKRRQLGKLMRLLFPPCKDVATGCVNSGLYVRSYFVYVDFTADFVVVFEVADVNPLLLCSVLCACSFSLPASVLSSDCDAAVTSQAHN